MTWRHNSAAKLPKRERYRHAFVETLPEKLDEGVLYISVQYATAAHNCFCGCGREVVTPLHPTKWQMLFDGVNVSLSPSVGSWSLACKSHYWLQEGRVSWADVWSDAKIAAARRNDIVDQGRYFERADERFVSPTMNAERKTASLWRSWASWLMGK